MSAIDNARAAADALESEWRGAEYVAGVEYRAVVALRDLIAEHERLTAPPTEKQIEAAAKAAWVVHYGDNDWARGVVDDVFSPADDWPEEALEMAAVARAVLTNQADGDTDA